MFSTIQLRAGTVQRSSSTARTCSWIDRVWILALVIVCSTVSSLAAETLSLAGKIVREVDSTGTEMIKLISPRSLEAFAILQGVDPVSFEEWVIIQAEPTGTTYLGLPQLKVIDVLRERWEEPAILRHHQKGPSNYSGFGAEPGFHDYEMIPYEDRRAYAHDTGDSLQNYVGSTVTDFVHPLIALQATTSSTNIVVRWSGFPGFQYDLLAATNVAGPYLALTNVTRLTPGQISVPVSTNEPFKSFRVRY